MGDYKHVVILGADGAGAFFRNTETPNIDRIFRDGAVTYDMRVTAPTSSCPSWMSFFHGVNPEHHGLIENYFVEYFTYPSAQFKYPSFMKVVRDARPDADLAALYAWIGINGIVEDDAGIFKKHIADDNIPAFMRDEYLKDNMPTVLYVHFGRTDSAGHMYGYGSPEHLNQITLTDGYIGEIYDTLVERGMIDDTLFIVTSDHGGSAKWHGGLTDEEKYVMFAAAGRTVEQGGVPQSMEIRDVASVVLYAFGIEQPSNYTSRVPSGLFAGVAACERPVYYDEGSPRYHVPEQTRDTCGFIEKNLGKRPVKYYSFDNGDLGDLVAHDSVSFGEGYFGTAVVLDDGYLTLDDFPLDKTSFTLAAWVKTPSPHCQEPIFANNPVKFFAGEPYRETDGFVLALTRNTYVLPAIHTTHLAIAANGKPFTVEAAMPTDFPLGWIHIAMVVDRESGIASIYHDFKLVAKNLAWGVKKDVALSGVKPGLVIGQDGPETFEHKCGLSLDEVLFFDSALTTEDMEKLASYYGKG